MWIFFVLPCPCIRFSLFSFKHLYDRTKIVRQECEQYQSNGIFSTLCPYENGCGDRFHREIFPAVGLFHILYVVYGQFFRISFGRRNRIKRTREFICIIYRFYTIPVTVPRCCDLPRLCRSGLLKGNRHRLMPVDG